LIIASECRLCGTFFFRIAQYIGLLDSFPANKLQILPGTKACHHCSEPCRNHKYLNV
jgi:hypothetical protein